MMKILGPLITLGLFQLMTACVPSASDSSACKSMGLQTSESLCSQASGGSCEMVSVQGSSGSAAILCWKQSSGGSNGFSTTGSSTTTSGASCTGSIPWSVGAWSPAACGAGIAQLTRSVTCTNACPCNYPATMPDTITSCTADLYQGSHYTSECTGLGGSVVWAETTKRVCKMPPTVLTCPGGWTAASANGVSYTSTYPASANDQTSYWGGSVLVFTGSHSALSPVPVESRGYCNHRNFWGRCTEDATVYAKVTGIACY